MPPVNKPRPGQKPQAQTSKKSADSNTTVIGIIIVIAVLALIAVGYFVGYPLLKKSSEPTTTIVIDSAPVDTTATTPPVVEDIIVKQESSSSVPKGYYIIVGSFRIQNNADRMVKNIRKDIKLEVLYFAELGLYRVSAGHYDNIHKAYNDTYSVKDIDGCTNAWVLENL